MKWPSTGRHAWISMKLSERSVNLKISVSDGKVSQKVLSLLCYCFRQIKLLNISIISWINWCTILVQENMQIKKMLILSFTEVVFRYPHSFSTIPKGLWIGSFGLYVFSGLENSVKWKGEVFQTKEKALKYIFLSFSSRQLADLFYQWYL